MTKRTGPSNLALASLIEELRASESGLWKRVAKDLSKSSRSRRVVNLYKISKCANEGETVIVPGKVLSIGELDKKVDVAAFSFSATARDKIQSANGSVMTIRELVAKNPTGKNVRILG